MTKKKNRLITLPRSIRRLFPNVTKAFDADKPVEVSVSRKDCKGAKKKDATECALARAARRDLQADGVIIGISSSYVIKGNNAYRFATPESVKREIVSFDRHQDFAPGDYYLTPKSPSARLGAKSSGGGGGGGKNKIARRKIHHSARVRVLPKGAE